MSNTNKLSYVLESIIEDQSLNDSEREYENDLEEIIEEKESITYGIKEMILKPTVSIITNINKVDVEDINLTNCIKINKLLLEKLEPMVDLSHSIAYKTRNTKDFKLYTL